MSERRTLLLRSVDARGNFETFLVSAIVAVLAIRGFLHLTGYPRVGGDTLHIAHMLWGGLLMLVALVLLLGWLGGAVRTIAALVGGVGFGAFIDEVGKFVTADNDYFFRPTFALIYLTFVLLYLAFRAVQRSELEPIEKVANALELTQEAVRHDLDADEKRRALELLAAAPSDPVVAALRDALDRIAHVQPVRRGRIAHTRALARETYARTIRHPLFRTVVVTAAVALATVALAALVAAALRIEPGGVSAVEMAELIARAVPAAILLSGLRHLRRSRLAAWRTFHRALLFQIFVTRVLTFYVAQLGALIGLAGDVVILSTVRTLIQQEERMARESGARAAPAPPR